MTEREREVTPPRVLEIDLASRGARPSVRAGPFAARGAALERVAARSGAALALALIAREAGAPDREVPLVLSVGDGVRRGLPTAARATVAARAPLSGRFVDGQVGGDLGRRLASVTDALLLRGRTASAGACLVIDERGAARLESRPELRGASPRERLAFLAGRFPGAAALCTGPASERGIPFASLAAGGDVAHFVGRGGLGAVLARHGLSALVVEAPEVASAAANPLASALAHSPRLAARAAGGTLELFEAHAARGGAAQARAVAAELRGAARQRHGCSGCPTPCGWAFERPRGAPQPARFGATFALGLRLGLERAEDALALLARCDDAGLDAKELGAALAILGTARARGLAEGEPLRGRLAACERALDELLAGRGEGARLAPGAAALARELGLEHELPATRSSASEHDVAARLAAAVGTRGGDPQRAFPFLVHDGAERALLETLLAPLRLPAGAEDPRHPAGKGLLLWWHENLSAAIDSTGFCAFSAAALLCDGILGLDDLARWIAPSTAHGARSPGGELLAQGAQFLHLVRDLDERWGAAPPPPGPEFSGPWREYARLRGLDGRGRLTPRARESFEQGRPIAEVEPVAGADRPAQPQPVPASVAPGRVRLRCGAPLAEALGGESEIALELPAPLSVVLAEVARRAGPSAHLLLRDGRSLAVVYRAGERLAPAQAVRDGDELELLLVISGGAR
jgi:aldehyde:ferredoxin oxidoreductase